MGGLLYVYLLVTEKREKKREKPRLCHFYHHTSRCFSFSPCSFWQLFQWPSNHAARKHSSRQNQVTPQPEQVFQRLYLYFSLVGAFSSVPGRLTIDSHLPHFAHLLDSETSGQATWYSWTAFRAPTVGVGTGTTFPVREMYPSTSSLAITSMLSGSLVPSGGARKYRLSLPKE